MTNDRRLIFSSCALVIVLVAGCTPGVASPQTTPAKTTPTMQSTPPPTSTSPTPTSTWAPSQAAAVEVVTDYFSAGERLFADPSRYTTADATTALKPLTGQDMLDGNLALFKKLKADGKHYEGAARLAWIEASGIFGSGVGESVNVTVCRDPQGQALVDSKGKVLSRVPVAIREFEVRRDSAGLRVVGEKEGFGPSCP